MAKSSARARATSATITDVARELGVSISTVSRALTRPQLLRPETRARVLAAVEQLNYRPNLLARGLKSGRAGAILLVVPNLSPFFMEIFAGAEEAAHEAGFSVLLGHSAEDPAREIACFDQVASGRADGIISAAVPSIYASGKRPLPPLVMVMERCPERTVPLIRVDDDTGAMRATEHLIGLGHRRIAHICGNKKAQSSARRLEGYRRALDQAGLRAQPEWIHPGDYSVQSGMDAVRRLMLLKHPPTAIFCANDEMAYGAIHALHLLGLRVPQDISIAGCDDQNMAAYSSPPLTTLHIPRHDLGRRAALELIDKLQGRDVAHEVLLPTRLVVRESTAAPAAASRARPAPR